jgi:uncharacterized protein (TIGR03067 family)
VSRIIPTLVAVTPLFGLPSSDGEAGDDLAKLQGKWRVTEAFKADGSKSPAEEIRASSEVATIDGDRLTMRYTTEDGKNLEVPITIKLDPSTSPKAIDWIGREGNVRKGIYRVEGDTLELAWENVAGEGGDGRPLKLAPCTGDAGRRWVYIVYRRE